jgi:NitT/TauT family transport system substrate-binding protein
MAPLTGFGKVLIVALIVIVAGTVIWFASGKQSIKDMTILPSGKATAQTSGKTTAAKAPGELIGAINTWAGFAGGLYFNDGFTPGPNSQYKEKYDLSVTFRKIESVDASRAAWKSGEIDFLGFCTLDALPTEIEGLKSFNPKVIYQIDWSHEGDLVWAREGINTITDLKGKTIAVAVGTPSHTLLLNLFDAGEIKQSDVKIIEVADGIAAADLAKKRQVDAAVIWTPDDQDIIAAVGGKVLYSTEKASRIIADVILVKQATLDAKRAQFTALVEGWLLGSADINTNSSAKLKAAKILSEGFMFPEDWCLNGINKAQLATYGDNANFFNISGSYPGVTAEVLYNRMATLYGKSFNNAGDRLAPQSVMPWRMLGDASILRSLSQLANQVGQQAAPEPTFNAMQIKVAPSISTKRASITFASNSYDLSADAKYIIDLTFADIARSFANAGIRIEGNTDDKGSDQINIPLSKQRAQAVADYLVQRYQFDRNKFDVRGNGSSKPVGSNSTPEGRQANRRTDLELLAE